MSEFEGKSRRRRWGRAVLLVMMLALALVLTLPPVFSNRQDQHIIERVARYRAAGEPTTIADLMTPPYADEENAVIELRQAAAILTAYQKSSSAAWKDFQEVDHVLPLTGKERAALQTVVKDNADVFPLMDTAMAKEQFYWPNQPTQPFFAWMLPDLTPQRALGGYLESAALVAHDQGDDAAAITNLLRAAFVARAMEHHPQCLVVTLVSFGIRSAACDRVFMVVPDLNIGAAPGASPAQIGKLIRELTDETGADDAIRRGVLAERLAELDLSEQVLRGKMSGAAAVGINSGAASFVMSPVGRYVAGPWIRADAIVMLDAATATIEALKEPGWSNAHERIRHLSDPLNADPMRHTWARMLMPSMERAVLTCYRNKADRRMAATALAIRWYASEHQDRLPAKLEDLVPKYLVAVPMDPFAPGGKTALRYIADGPDPRLYSVGKNGTDEGGSDKTDPANAKDTGRWSRVDAVVHLHRQPRDLSALPGSMKD